MNFPTWLHALPHHLPLRCRAACLFVYFTPVPCCRLPPPLPFIPHRLTTAGMQNTSTAYPTCHLHYLTFRRFLTILLQGGTFGSYTRTGAARVCLAPGLCLTARHASNLLEGCTWHHPCGRTLPPWTATFHRHPTPVVLYLPVCITHAIHTLCRIIHTY